MRACACVHACVLFGNCICEQRNMGYLASEEPATFCVGLPQGRGAALHKWRAQPAKRLKPHTHPLHKAIQNGRSFSGKQKKMVPRVSSVSATSGWRESALHHERLEAQIASSAQNTFLCRKIWCGPSSQGLSNTRSMSRVFLGQLHLHLKVGDGWQSFEPWFGVLQQDGPSAPDLPTLFRIGERPNSIPQDFSWQPPPPPPPALLSLFAARFWSCRASVGRRLAQKGGMVLWAISPQICAISAVMFDLNSETGHSE